LQIFAVATRNRAYFKIEHEERNTKARLPAGSCMSFPVFVAGIGTALALPKLCAMKAPETAKKNAIGMERR
jgi:hypothetical protein